MPSSAFYLRNLGLLQGLPDGAARALEQHTRVHYFTRRDIIFPQKMPADTIYLLAEGTVEICCQEGGKETILLVLTPGEFITEPVENPAAIFPMQARALDDCVVCTIARRDLEALIQVYPALAWRFLTWLSRNIRHAYSRIHAMASCDVPEKLLALIRQLADRHGVPTHEGMEIPVLLTHHELAALIGSCREAVSRGLKALRGRGVISIRSRHITLKTPASHAAADA